MIELVKGVALLLAIALLHRYVIQLFKKSELRRQVACGLLFGVMCVIVMSTPLEIVPGVIFDPRSVVLSTAGLFSGLAGSILAAVIAGSYRLWIGGPGAPVGVSVIIMCAVAGLLYRWLYSRELVSLSALSLLVFGAIVHLFEIGMFMMLPENIVDKVMQTVAMPLIVTFTPGVMLLGLLLADNERTAAIQHRLVSRTRQALEADATSKKALADLQHKQDLIDEHAIYSETDAAGKIVSVNRLFCEISGYSADELIGQDHSILNSGEHSESFFKDMWQTVRSGKTWRGVIKNRRKDGSEFWVKSTLRPIFGEDKSITGFAAITTDVTEDMDRQIEAVLARNDALEANAAKSRFIATMSHELRTPLNAILGFTEMIRAEAMGPVENAKYVEYIEDIHASGQVLRGMIDDILDITRLDLSSYEFSNEATDMKVLVAEITNRFKMLAEKSGIAVSFHASPDFPRLVHGDRKVVNHILNNLVSNALKATTSGDSITVSLRMEEEGLVLSVADTGRGMPPELVSQLGKPFVRIKDEHVARSKSEGIGLGFYITRSLVEARGGHIEVESVPGEGTEVRAIYPHGVLHTED